MLVYNAFWLILWCSLCASLNRVHFQQLAALLIARQVIGNLKESALPYMLEHLRLAKMSFDMWGALSPIDPKGPTTDTPEQQVKDGESPSTEQASSKRSMSQAELESSLYKVGLI